MPPKPLSAAELRLQLDPATLPFATTAELPPMPRALGQERATEALRFGMGMRQEGFHLFVIGSPGVGKHHVVLRMLEEFAATAPVPGDWCYVHNFDDPNRPKALPLPPGRAGKLKADMDHLIEDLLAALPAAFESEDYLTRRQSVLGELEERQEAGFNEVKDRAEKRGIALIRTPTGVGMAPMKEAEMLTPQQVAELPPDEQITLRGALDATRDDLAEMAKTLPKLEKERRERLRQFDQEVAAHALDHLIDELKERWGDQAGVVAYLDAVRTDVIDNAGRFLAETAQAPSQQVAPAVLAGLSGDAELWRYMINVLVDHGDHTQAPLVYEDNPTFSNLVGRVEHESAFGALSTDFTLIRPGALHKANGGILVLDVRRVIESPLAWDQLKRVLRAGTLRPESMGEAMNLISTVSLEPEAIPLHLKVVLLGEPALLPLLSRYDPDFDHLFKVVVDFEEDIRRAGDGALQYARWLSGLITENRLRAVDQGGVAALLAESSRLAGDLGRLSLHARSVVDLLCEADWCASEAKRELITVEDVRSAVSRRARREGRRRERVLEQITEGTVRLETTGTAVGEINGLSVMDTGRITFGRPCRISARVWPGRGRVIDIERETKLGGSIHSKGVLILSGFLGARFGVEGPLALSASLVFEQSYGGIDGDSASLAELCVLLSALAETPLRQDLAVTGSVDQHGRVQAVGGLNEKIEGFYDLCVERGLSGEQGALLPATNARHLGLREDVVQAVADLHFHVWSVETVDEAMELLTGLDAAVVDRRVRERLSDFAKIQRRSSKEKEE